MTALEAGGCWGPGSDNFSADNWNLGLNQVAQTANTKATGNTVNFTDAATQLTTAGFNLSAQATAAHSPPALPNYANASGLQAGAFVLFDETRRPHRRHDHVRPLLRHERLDAGQYGGELFADHAEPAACPPSTRHHELRRRSAVEQP